ncbi:MAG: Hsp20/alpha crystallin family protein [Lautropia sp.]
MSRKSLLPNLFGADPFDDTMRGFMRPWRWEPVESPQIRLEVDETDKDYNVKAEIPGVRKEDITVDVNGNVVSISAEVKSDTEEKKGGRVLHSERNYGFVSRSFTLGTDVDQAASVAKYQDGILSLTLPKKVGSRQERILVR